MAQRVSKLKLVVLNSTMLKVMVSCILLLYFASNFTDTATESFTSSLVDPDAVFQDSLICGAL